MPSDCLSFSETSFVSPLLQDYLLQRKELRPFYQRFPEIEAFAEQIQEKQAHFSSDFRRILVEDLRRQYAGLKQTELVQSQLELLSQDQTFTVTTGHQLNLGTGPLYFLYKISATINLCRQLKERYPKNDFVPIYWMATEDHDFEEINFLHLKGQKVQWSRPFGGAVGRMDLQGIEPVLDQLAAELGEGKYNEELIALFREAYQEGNNLAEATRVLVHHLFGQHGLVILDADSHALKTLFRPQMRQELEKKTTFNEVEETNARLKAVDARYKIQVNPRECNLFYLAEGQRERIVETASGYELADSKQAFENSALLKALEESPERFSPNVMMRPLYQEVILPNLCYIGGGGELAYWLQLKDSFTGFGVPFPMLLLRNSVLLWSQKEAQKWAKMGLTIQDLFRSSTELVNQQVARTSDIPLSFAPQKELLNQQFKDLFSLAEQTDASFLGAVAAQERKQIKGLEQLEKRLLKAQKRKLQEEITRLTDLHETLFPNGKLQERFENFAPYYAQSKGELVGQLIQELDPIGRDVLVLTL